VGHPGYQSGSVLFWETRRYDWIPLCVDSHRVDHAASTLTTVVMLPARLMRVCIGGLDRLGQIILPPDERPLRQRRGQWGEEEAYFYLKELGYVIVARNFRSPRCRGEIDLIGWEQDILCFVEVKTRSSRDVKTAEAAVDRHMRREVAMVIREYLRRLPPSC
jgi:Holliday junction resolvase-like predicted endonuclease